MANNMKFFLTLFLTIKMALVFGQNIIDPYKDYSGYDILTEFKYPPPLIYNATNPNNFSYYPIYRTTQSCIQYTGEYMFMLSEHPWVKSGGVLNTSQNAKTFTVEAVSFPFTIPCWDQPLSCAYPLYGTNTDRIFMMPDDSYSSSTNSWDHLNRLYDGTFLLNSQTMQYVTSSPAMLISRQFIQDDNHSLYQFNGGFYPQTILKHTIYLHCTSDPQSDIIDSLCFYYDNTRGTMRSYPFSDNNDNMIGCELWDVVFKPEVLVDLDELTNVNYGLTSNDSWFDGGTINYYPFNESNNSSCTSYNPTSGSTFVNNFTNNPLNSSERRAFDYINPYQPEFSLNSNLLKGVNTRDLVGYTVVNNILTKRPGLMHTYTVNTNFDIQLINPIEKIFFNPSEVILTPNPLNSAGNNSPIELIFPEDYTFKTILGRYPSNQEVIDANLDLQNGGPYSDLRNVPVPVNATDLPWSTTNSSDYPEVMWDNPNTVDNNGFYMDERFGYYKIERDATLSISSCVKIFDARFSVLPGGTLKFIDYSTVLGNEDVNTNYGRYKIRGEGGAILRNYASEQYVQNGLINQTIPLNYIAYSEITAGNNADPDIDQPTGDYLINSGANVTFEVGDYVHLINGFQVNGGDFHAYINENLPSFTQCNNSNRLRPMTSKIIEVNRSTDLYLEILPNPTNNTIKIKNVANNLKNYNISVEEITGKVVFNILISNFDNEVNVENLKTGVYIIKILETKQQSKFVKL